MASPPAQPAKKPATVTKGHTVAFALVALICLFILVLLPFALSSVFRDISDQAAPIFILNRASNGAEVKSDIYMQVIALNEWEGTASIRVTAHQNCERKCPWGDRYLFVSVYSDSDEKGRPTSEVVTLPATQRDSVQVLKLPIFGDPIRYPFDHYRLGIGVIIDRLLPDGSTTTLTPEQARAYATISLQARIPRVAMSKPVTLNPESVHNEGDVEEYAVVEFVTFERPVYLRVLTVLLVILVTAAAAYAVFMRPLDQLIINAGALVLGVWGIRAVLLGTNLQGLTAVDLSLTMVILFLLVAITVRTMYLLEERSKYTFFHRLHRAKDPPPPPPPKTDPSAADNVPEARQIDG